MLEQLRISNYALIDEIEITFGPGLNVITGETGAGKSIIMGALSMIFGERADSAVVSDPARKSVIEATFWIKDNSAIRTLIEENAIETDAEDPDHIILRREIAPNGRSRAFVNDSPVTLNVLKHITVNLVDIHSQHQNLLLSQPDFQLDVIDSLAANSALLDDYRSHYSKLKEAIRALKRLRAAVEKSRDDEDFMRYQLEQLDSLDPQPGEQEELERERDIQSNHSDLKSTLVAALEALCTTENSALPLIECGLQACEELEQILPSADNLITRLRDIQIELQDITESLMAADRDLEADPRELEAIESRLTKIYDLERRHKVETVEDLVEIRQSLSQRLSLLDNGDERIAAHEKNVRKLLVQTKECASAITQSRKDRASVFAEELKERAVPLGMRNLECEISITPADLSPSGADKVDFLFAFNKNQPPVPVGKTASGGEISRLMLSIKAIIARNIKLPTLILDEIDTGVSGDVANRMGELMLSVGRYTQVIAITHLPQIAAKGERHFKVYKEDSDTATHSRIKQLDPDERIDEIAVMLSGDGVDGAARANAKSLLKTKN